MSDEMGTWTAVFDSCNDNLVIQRHAIRTCTLVCNTRIGLCQDFIFMMILLVCCVYIVCKTFRNVDQLARGNLIQDIQSCIIKSVIFVGPRRPYSPTREASQASEFLASLTVLKAGQAHLFLGEFSLLRSKALTIYRHTDGVGSRIVEKLDTIKGELVYSGELRKTCKFVFSSWVITSDVSDNQRH